jgi:hypothetical protein
MATHTMAKPTTNNTNATASLNEDQLEQVRAVVAEYLMSDEFDVKLNHADVVDACKTALQDKEVQTSLSEILKK